MLFTTASTSLASAEGHLALADEADRRRDFAAEATYLAERYSRSLRPTLWQRAGWRRCGRDGEWKGAGEARSGAAAGGEEAG